jgi:hypothetical protein
MFCWPCIVGYQYNETKVMHYSFNLLRIKGLYMFRALLAHPQQALNKWHLVYCVCIVSVYCVCIVSVYWSVISYTSRINKCRFLIIICTRRVINYEYKQSVELNATRWGSRIISELEEYLHCCLSTYLTKLYQLKLLRVWSNGGKNKVQLETAAILVLLSEGKKSVKVKNQETSRCSDQDSNRGPSEYDTLSSEWSCLVEARGKIKEGTKQRKEQGE